MDLFNLKGKTALVTGASNGLGKRFARCLSAAGTRVIMAARNLEKLETLSQEIPNTMPLQLDIADKNSVQRAFEHLEEGGELTGSVITVDGGISWGGGRDEGKYFLYLFLRKGFIDHLKFRGHLLSILKQ